MKFVFIITHKGSGYEQLCVGADTKVSTPFGLFTIKELSEKKKPDDKFLVYCYDFSQQDYTLGWAYNPRFVKLAKTIEIVFEDGSNLICTPDHKILLDNAQWIEASKLKIDDGVMPFYRIKANPAFTRVKTKQFARIWTRKDGWKQERQFLDEWRAGKKFDRNEELYKIIRAISSGLNTRQLSAYFKMTPQGIAHKLRVEGFSYVEIKKLTRENPDTKRVIGVFQNDEEKEVYDLSVMGHENFVTDSAIVHNCMPLNDNRYLSTFPQLTYTHPIDLKKLEAKDKYVRAYADVIVNNYQFACQALYKFCYFIYLLGNPNQTMHELTKELSAEGAYNYYRFRLRRMYEMSFKTPKAICVTWENINNIKEFLDLNEFNITLPQYEEIHDHNALLVYNKYLPLINNACNSKSG
jgi:Intein splicing domain